MGWVAVLAVAMSPAVEATRILVERPHVVLYGDQALLELGARRAAHLDQLVGPYSRTGFHHPGPIVFYLLAPFVRILGTGGSGLYLGAVAINGAALVATVAVLWRRLGPVAATWSAAAIDLFCVCVGVGTLREPWNPYLVVAPMALFVVLWSTGVAGSVGAGVWALVIGSYEVQTDIATAPVILLLAAVLLVHMARTRRASDRWTAPGIAVLAVIWVAPIVELWRDHPNNAQAMWDFFTSGHATASIGSAARIAADAITILPFGNHDYVLSLHRTGWEIGLAAVLLGIGAVAALRMRHRILVGPLAATAVIGMVIGALSLVRTDGPVYLYFAVWLAFVPLSLLLAIGIGWLERHPDGFRVVSGVTALCLVLATLTVVEDARLGSVAAGTGSGPWPAGKEATPAGREQTVRDTAALSQAAWTAIPPGVRRVGLTIGSSSLWPYAAGVVSVLDEHGVQSTVSPAAWQLYFGHERAPGRPVGMSLALYPASQQPAGVTVIATIDGVVLTSG